MQVEILRSNNPPTVGPNLAVGRKTCSPTTIKAQRREIVLRDRPLRGPGQTRPSSGWVIDRQLFHTLASERGGRRNAQGEEKMKAGRRQGIRSRDDRSASFHARFRPRKIDRIKYASPFEARGDVSIVNRRRGREAAARCVEERGERR